MKQGIHPWAQIWISLYGCDGNSMKTLIYCSPCKWNRVDFLWVICKFIYLFSSTGFTSAVGLGDTIFLNANRLWILCPTPYTVFVHIPFVWLQRSSGSLQENSMANLYDSWRSEWNGYYYNAAASGYYGGSSSGGYGPGRRRSDYDTNFWGLR